MLIDFLVVAPLEEEIRGISSALGADGATRHPMGQSTFTFDVVLTAPNDRHVYVRVVKLRDAGTLNAAAQALPLIMRWRPRCVVSFGIAGGFLEHVAYGGVIVATIVWYYEPAKETVDPKSGRPVHRNAPISFPCDQDLIDSFCSTVDPPLVLPGQGTVHYGPLASGEKLIAAVDASSRMAIDTCHRKMLGVEMEAAGVAAAAQHCRDSGCRFLAVKGVSDDAGAKMAEGTSDDGRQQRRNDAIANASEVVRVLVTRVDPGLHKRPSVEPDQLRDLVSQFRKCIPTNLLVDFSEEQLRRTLYPPKPRPTIFYHWIVLHAHMHWVDMCFLLLLHKFLKIEYPVHLLITDNEQGCPEDGVRAATTMISDVLGPLTPVTCKSEVGQSKYKFCAFAADQGWSEYHPLAEAPPDIADPIHAQLVKENEKLDFWLPFIAYCAQADERCIVLIWRRDSATYERLREIVWLEPLIVRTADVLLGGQRGKFDSPGKDIVIDPPLYGSILKWLESLPDIETLRAFTEYLSVGFSDNVLTADVLLAKASRMLLQVPGTTALLRNGGADPGRVDCVRRLLSILHEWNVRYFAAWS